jgi:hypothetical protein
MDKRGIAMDMVVKIAIMLGILGIFLLLYATWKNVGCEALMSITGVC